MLNRELGIGIVAYSPLGRGFFSLGPKVVESFPEGDYRKVCTFLTFGVHFFVAYDVCHQESISFNLFFITRVRLLHLVPFSWSLDGSYLIVLSSWEISVILINQLHICRLYRGSNLKTSSITLMSLNEWVKWQREKGAQHRSLLLLGFIIEGRMCVLFRAQARSIIWTKTSQPCPWNLHPMKWLNSSLMAQLIMWRVIDFWLKLIHGSTPILLLYLPRKYLENDSLRGYDNVLLIRKYADAKIFIYEII